MDSKRTLLLMLMPLMAVVALAQRSFTGMIVDDAQDPIPQTTVKLLKMDSTLVKGALTDMEGKFKMLLPILLGGPEFNKQWQGIRIHMGNTVKDTQGCILVGRNQRVGEVLESRKWLYELKQKIVEAKDKGEAVWLTIK